MWHSSPKEEPRRIITCGPWDSLQKIDGWRKLPEFKEFFANAKRMCDEVAPLILKKRRGYPRLHARQPINGDGTAGGVAPELDKLLDGEDTSEVLNASAILSMAAFELVISIWIPGDPADMGNTDYVAVQIGFQDACTTCV